jgi:hypothetical protein
MSAAVGRCSAASRRGSRAAALVRGGFGGSPGRGLPLGLPPPCVGGVWSWSVARERAERQDPSGLLWAMGQMTT